MAEASIGLPQTQASNAVEISSDIISRTVAQVDTNPSELEDGVTGQRQGNTVASASANNVSVNDIFKTLNNIAVRFDSFEQQARIDREKVATLCEKLNGDITSVKKGKTPKKTVVSKTVDVINTDLSNHRGARPRTQLNRQLQPSSDDLLTYEQCLLLHQARTGNSGEMDTSATASSSGPVRPNDRVFSDIEP